MKQFLWIPQNASPDSAPPARDRVEDPGEGVLGQKGERRHVRPIAAHFLPSLFWNSRILQENTFASIIDFGIYSKQKLI